MVIDNDNLTSDNWIFKSNNELSFINRIISESKPLNALCYKIYQGFVLTPTEVFPVSIVGEHDSFYKIKPIKLDDIIYEIEKDLLVPIVKSSSIFRYHFESKNYHSVFPYRYIDDKKVELISESVLKDKYPKALHYLTSKSEYLKSRENGKWASSPNWYEYSRKQNFECQKMKKILVPGLATNARYALADDNTFIDQGSYGIILNENNKQFEKFILGVLNSKLLDFIFKSGSGTLSGGYFSYQTKYLNDLPIKLPKKLSEKIMHDEIVKNVELVLKLTADIQIETDTAKKEQMKGRVAYAEQKINEIVYELYNLTPEEIKIVEGQ